MPGMAWPASVGSMGSMGLIFALVAAMGVEGRAHGAEAAERAEVLVMGAAIDRLVAKQLPATFPIRGDRAAGIASMNVTLVEAVYCGAPEARRGRLVGLLRPASEASAGAPRLDGARDCRDKLDDVVRRGSSNEDDGAAVEILVEWVSWQLRLTLGQVATTGPGAAALGAALVRLKAGGPLATLATNGIRLATARGSALELDLAIAFVKPGDAVLGTLTVAAPGARPGAPRPSLVEPAGAPPGSDAMAGATFSLTQRVVTLYSQDGPLVLDVEGQTIEVRGLQIWGAPPSGKDVKDVKDGNGKVVVRGRATSSALRESQRLTLEAEGADLRISDVRAEPETEDCSAASALAALGCRARNTARAAAAAAVTSAMASRYRGHLLRTLLPPSPFSFELGGRPLTLRLTPTRARATAAGLVVYGRGELE